MLALAWYKGRDGAGAGVDVWRILHAACCMLHAACCMLRASCCMIYAVCSMMSGLNLGWWLVVGLAMIKGSIEPFLELVWL